MGHDTHGLALLGAYLAELESGSMTREGDPAVLADAPAAVTWDGRRLPGPWLVLRAMQLATERAARCGTGTVVIRQSHHIGCLAAYHKRATDQGLMMLLTCSDANTASVAPAGGLDPVFTPNPISAGIPTGGTPVLVDISTAATTNGLTNRLHKEGRKLPAQWLIDGNGRPSDDPAVLFTEPKGTILPLGGIASGHKGYGLSLLGRGADRRPRRPWPGRSAPGLGRHGVPAGDRSARLRRARRLHAPDRRGRAAVPRITAGARPARRCARRASAGWTWRGGSARPG